MKRLILASMICLAFTVSSYAQERPPSQTFRLVPTQPVQPSVWGVVQGLDLLNGSPKQEPASVLELKGSIPVQTGPVQTGVCSVPLLEAHANANDPGIA